MRVNLFRTIGVLAAVALLSLASCSAPSARVGTPAFYWAAARETYSAGDYLKTIDHLDHLIEDSNDYTGRAVPWSLVVTSGMAAGYMELADYYTAGSRANDQKALAFRRKASEYRATANGLVLRFAQNVEKMDRVPPGTVPLAFGMPRGNSTVPPLLAQVAEGIELQGAETEVAKSLTIERNVLLAACLAAGAPNDIAKTTEILGHHTALMTRATFAKAVAQMLEKGSGLYTRDKLDEPQKMAILRQLANTVSTGLLVPGTAMVVDVHSK
jgi:hypothetical protein